MMRKASTYLLSVVLISIPTVAVKAMDGTHTTDSQTAACAEALKAADASITELAKIIVQRGKIANDASQRVLVASLDETIAQKRSDLQKVVPADQLEKMITEKVASLSSSGTVIAEFDSASHSVSAHSNTNADQPLSSDEAAKVKAAIQFGRTQQLVPDKAIVAAIQSGNAEAFGGFLLGATRSAAICKELGSICYNLKLDLAKIKVSGGRDLISFALANRKTGMARELVHSGLLIDLPMLKQIAQQPGSGWIIKEALEKEPAFRHSIDALLLNSAIGGDLEGLQYLVGLGASVNVASDEGKSALAYATQNNRIKAMEFLIDHSADLNWGKRVEDKPLHIAISNNNLDAVQTLAYAGADLQGDSLNQFKNLASTIFNNATRGSDKEKQARAILEFIQTNGAIP